MAATHEHLRSYKHPRNPTALGSRLLAFACRQADIGHRLDAVNARHVFAVLELSIYCYQLSFFSLSHKPSGSVRPAVPGSKFMLGGQSYDDQHGAPFALARQSCREAPPMVKSSLQD